MYNRNDYFQNTRFIVSPLILERQLTAEDKNVLLQHLHKHLVEYQRLHRNRVSAHVKGLFDEHLSIRDLSRVFVATAKHYAGRGTGRVSGIRSDPLNTSATGRMTSSTHIQSTSTTSFYKFLFALLRVRIDKVENSQELMGILSAFQTINESVGLRVRDDRGAEQFMDDVDAEDSTPERPPILHEQGVRLAQQEGVDRELCFLSQKLRWKLGSVIKYRVKHQIIHKKFLLPHLPLLDKLGIWQRLHVPNQHLIYESLSPSERELITPPRAKNKLDNAEMRDNFMLRTLENQAAAADAHKNNTKLHRQKDSLLKTSETRENELVRLNDALRGSSTSRLNALKGAKQRLRGEKVLVLGEVDRMNTSSLSGSSFSNQAGGGSDRSTSDDRSMTGGNELHRSSHDGHKNFHPRGIQSPHNPSSDPHVLSLQRKRKRFTLVRKIGRTQREIARTQNWESWGGGEQEHEQEQGSHHNKKTSSLFRGELEAGFDESDGDGTKNNKTEYEILGRTSMQSFVDIIKRQ